MDKTSSTEYTGLMDIHVLNGLARGVDGYIWSGLMDVNSFTAVDVPLDDKVSPFSPLLDQTGAQPDYESDELGDLDVDIQNQSYHPLISANDYVLVPIGLIRDQSDVVIGYKCAVVAFLPKGYHQAMTRFQKFKEDYVEQNIKKGRKEESEYLGDLMGDEGYSKLCNFGFQMWEDSDIQDYVLGMSKKEFYECLTESYLS